MSKFISKNKIYIAILIILIFLIIFFFASHVLHKQKNSPVKFIEVGQVNAVLPVTQGIKTTLEINGISYEEKITGPISVYDLMSKMQNEGEINFTNKNYIGMGELIDGINGIKNNTNQSWIYYVNGKEASIGVSNYKINPGDVVSWKYEKSNY